MDIVITLVLVVGYLLYPKASMEGFIKGFKEGIKDGINRK